MTHRVFRAFAKLEKQRALSSVEKLENRKNTQVIFELHSGETPFFSCVCSYPANTKKTSIDIVKYVTFFKVNECLLICVDHVLKKI